MASNNLSDIFRSGLLERMPLMERLRNGNGEAITNGDTGIDGEDDLVDTEEMDRPKQIKKAEVSQLLCYCLWSQLGVFFSFLSQIIEYDVRRLDV